MLSKYSGDANLKINYKYIDELNKIVEIQIPLDKYSILLVKRFNNLIELLKEDMLNDKKLKDVVVQVNSMIIQLNKSVVVDN
jgi:hypothetical protein